MNVARAGISGTHAATAAAEAAEVVVAAAAAGNSPHPACIIEYDVGVLLRSLLTLRAWRHVQKCELHC